MLIPEIVGNIGERANGIIIYTLASYSLQSMNYIFIGK